VAVLKAFGLPTDALNLAEARAFFDSQSVDEHIQRVFEMAGISTVVMTNDPLDPQEAPIWLNGVSEHPQFRAVLRLDKILRQWTANWQVLAGQGYKVDAQASGKSAAEVQRFLVDWCERMRPMYMAVSPARHFPVPIGDCRQSPPDRSRVASLPRTQSSAIAYDWRTPAS